MAKLMASATGWMIREGRKLKKIGSDNESPQRSPCLGHIRTKNYNVGSHHWTNTISDIKLQNEYLRKMEI